MGNVYKKRSFEIFYTPVIILVIGFMLEAWLVPIMQERQEVRQSIDALFWLTTASLLNRGLLIFFWQPIQSIHHVPIPKLLINLTTVVIWLITFVVIVDVVFEKSIVGFVTTSTVVVGVFGIALRDLIDDFLAGIFISFEQSIRIGDWITVGEKYTGMVVEIGSRTTRLVNHDEITMIVPNSKITKSATQNYSQPEPCWRDTITITLGYEVTFDQVRRILLSAVKKVPELAAIPRASHVMLDEYTDRGISWKVLFWVPNYAQRNNMRTKLNRQILRNIHYAGLSIPYPKNILLRKQNSDYEIDATTEVYAVLRRVSLFKSLSEDELQWLSENAVKRIYATEDVLMRQGDSADFSLFILHSGLVEVSINDKKIAMLSAGDFFGEMSLLTGAPRLATVTSVVDTFVIKISREIMNRIIQNRPEIANAMSEVLAKRQMANQKISEATLPEERYEQEQKTLTERIYAQICHCFFGTV